MGLLSLPTFSELSPKNHIGFLAGKYRTSCARYCGFTILKDPEYWKYILGKISWALAKYSSVMLGMFCLLIVRNVVWVRVWVNQWLAILFSISTALQVTTLVYAVLIQTLIRLMLASTSTSSSNVYSIFTMFIMFVSPGI